MKQRHVVHFERVITIIIFISARFPRDPFCHTHNDCVEMNISVLPGSRGRQSQCEDGRGVQGVIRLVTTAAAAAVSYATGLWGLRLLDISLM